MSDKCELRVTRDANTYQITCREHGLIAMFSKAHMLDADIELKARNAWEQHVAEDKQLLTREQVKPLVDALHHINTDDRYPHPLVIQALEHAAKLGLTAPQIVYCSCAKESTYKDGVCAVCGGYSRIWNEYA